MPIPDHEAEGCSNNREAPDTFVASLARARYVALSERMSQARSLFNRPLTFADSSTYEAIGEDDRISVLGLSTITPGEDLRCVIAKPDGRHVHFSGRHTFSDEQLQWFRVGSALNVIRNKRVRDQHSVMTPN